MVKNRVNGCEFTEGLVSHDGFYLDADFLSNFLMDDFRNRDVVVGNSYREFSGDVQFPTLVFDLAFDDPFLFNAVDIQFAFRPDDLNATLPKICFFNDFS